MSKRKTATVNPEVETEEVKEVNQATEPAETPTKVVEVKKKPWKLAVAAGVGVAIIGGIIGAVVSAVRGSSDDEDYDEDESDYEDDDEDSEDDQDDGVEVTEF